ncbi:MAG TPA: PIN domain-containing protein [Verrucomicrobiae bacterium]|jgi:predicted nucleic-acid-binding protein|nr:PIN domain-containing protein [Verrucomicrobiae bacterium]
MAAVVACDASVVVRFLTGDDKVQSAAAADLFRAAQAGKVRLLIPTSAIQETVYVLEKLYDLDAGAIATKLISLLALPNVENPDARWLMEALQFYRAKTSDFGDALLCAYAREQHCDVATFDKGILKKFPEVTAYSPADWPGGK